jgi:alkylmercury lyase
VQIDEAAAAAGLPLDAAHDAVELVASVGMAEVDGSTIVGMDGLTTRQTQHRILLNGVDLWTWCAYDIVGIAAALGTDAIGNTECGMCGREIEILVRGGRPDATTVIGWLPDESCSNVMAEFCPSALLFCSGSHLEEWSAKPGVAAGEALDVESLADRGRIAWRELVSTSN